VHIGCSRSEPACSINSYVMTSNAGIHSYEPLPIPFARLRSTRIGPLSDIKPISAVQLPGCARTVVNKRRLFGARGVLRQGHWGQVVLASQEDRARARMLSSVPKKPPDRPYSA
jgi:hypothetical protein